MCGVIYVILYIILVVKIIFKKGINKLIFKESWEK